MKRYLSVTEIATATQRERSTVIRWIKAGKLGAVRLIGKEYQVPVENFEKWWSKNMKVVGQEANGGS